MKKSELQSIIKEELKNVLKENEAKQLESNKINYWKSIAKNKEYKALDKKLTSEPGYYVRVAVNDLLKSAEHWNIYTFKDPDLINGIKDILDNIKTMYKEVDAEAAKMLKQKVAEIDAAMVTQLGPQAPRQ